MGAESLDSKNRLQRLESMIARLRRRAEQLEVISNKYWIVRRVIFVCGGLLILFVCKYSGGIFGAFLATIFVAVFLTVAVYHRKVRESISRNSVMIDIKQMQVARIRLDWDRMPSSNQSSAEAGHPFETDLDITGERSLHRLLDSAVTREGSSRLRSWLLNPAPDPLIIKKRQSLVSELSGRSLFRDKVQLYSAMAGKDVGEKSGQWDSNILVDWIQDDVRKDSLLPTVWLLGILAALNLTLLVLAGFQLVPQMSWPIAFVIYLGVMI